MGLFGFIVLHWGVFPRFLGYTISLSCPGYLLSSLLFLVWPGYDGELTVLFLLPVIISEFGLAGWLLANTPHPAKNRDIIPNVDLRSCFRFGGRNDVEIMESSEPAADYVAPQE